ncbi:glycine-rich domain-containing protein [Mycobacteroides abscessus]|uniref:glycine-rich domain-containing protein n=1 Tax=Mycobacteroides abscessus TaxID=36809 RepID=UPI0018E49C68|nr:hypothetical protein [Mycobacteroides abscessus]
MATSAAASTISRGCDLIDKNLWSRITRRIAKDEDVTLELAERILDQALAFLALCAEKQETDLHYSPSTMVDIGWHTFILYTREYLSFCDKIAGRFIHHEPSDIPGVTYPRGQIGRTVEALIARGFYVDRPLWLQANANLSELNHGAADCNSYCTGDSCSGGGGDGDSGCSH